MTTATITDLELLKTRISGAVGRRMPEHIARLGWDAGRLAACQRDRLRALLARAIAGSPFHAERLRGIDPGRFELADLARLPVMTKADMMENFDAATNDRRLTRDLVERHLARAVTDPGLVGHSEPGSTVLTFASDTCIAECTDDEGRPVPDGVASAKVLVTNLHNLTQPIIRYELTDRFTPAGTSEGGALRASVEGRSDDLFRYAEASVHPFVIGAPLLHAPRGAGIPGPADRTGRRHHRGDRRRLRLRRADDPGRAEPAPGGPDPPAGRLPPGRGPGP
jgi:hypothetical protein